ncbi:unnamed protein product [Rotaria sordida]|uniref:PH domain-containing protein n=1 Tax=Rotaria sordida TaxID=392033 RepID=A0A815FGR5_9BILA|nr:unnamed protein product [Rotaria sordida]
MVVNKQYIIFVIAKKKKYMLFEGPLSKWTNVIHGWQYRYFVLDPTQGMLIYYTSKDNMVKGERRGVVLLKVNHRLNFLFYIL